MSEENAPKMDSKKVINALKTWSPKGLCEGTLVQKNGEPDSTEACAVGCLILDFTFSKEGQKFFKKIDRNPYNFLKRSVYNRGGISGGSRSTQVKVRDAMRAYYGLTEATEGAVMNYNDTCVQNSGTPLPTDKALVPVSVQKTVYSLRKKFDKYAKKQYLKNEGIE